VSPAPNGPAQINRDGVGGEVTATGRYGQADANSVAAGVRAAGDPNDPATWPLDPLG
jgi:hypothetical protein